MSATTSPEYLNLAWKIRSSPPFERRRIIAWWIEDVKPDLSDDAKWALLDSLDSTFNENDQAILDATWQATLRKRDAV